MEPVIKSQFEAHCQQSCYSIHCTQWGCQKARQLKQTGWPEQRNPESKWKFLAP